MNGKSARLRECSPNKLHGEVEGNVECTMKSWLLPFQEPLSRNCDIPSYCDFSCGHQTFLGRKRARVTTAEDTGSGYNWSWITNSLHKADFHLQLLWLPRSNLWSDDCDVQKGWSLLVKGKNIYLAKLEQLFFKGCLACILWLCSLVLVAVTHWNALYLCLAPGITTASVGSKTSQPHAITSDGLFSLYVPPSIAFRVGWLWWITPFPFKCILILK